MAAGKLAGLKSALDTAARRSPPKPDPLAVAAPANESAKGGASRAGKIHVGAWLPGEYKTSLRMIQVKTDRSLQELMSEALNDLFAKHDVPTIGEG
jgi:Antitoxin-like ribbon-helix-helix